jgi:hypothetical protein
VVLATNEAVSQARFLYLCFLRAPSEVWLELRMA